MEYTITRALAELKLLKSRLNKEVVDLNLVAVRHGSKLRTPNSQYKEEDFIEQAKETYQSVCDLERRIKEIKDKIDQSNFTTKVVVGDKEMTIQEVLNFRNNILPLKVIRLTYLKKIYNSALNSYNSALEENQIKISKMTTDKSSTTTKISEIEEDAKKFVEKSYAVEMVDPLNIGEEIKSLEDEINVFKGNVDYVLSESNSITHIVIDD